LLRQLKLRWWRDVPLLSTLYDFADRLRAVNYEVQELLGVVTVMDYALVA